jgi:hypothetical protein
VIITENHRARPPFSSRFAGSAVCFRSFEALFKMVLDELDDPKTPPICLMPGSPSGDVLGDRELNRYVVEEMNAFSARFVERLRTAKQASRTGGIQVDNLVCHDNVWQILGTAFGQ